ncbi:MAG: UDP-N-acetylglucosamine 2-epimerase (non-hydrolyzing) [Candidatus Eremiobacteraeota bacterium]|nr:UDP-N-acetylglucosamine 2-epimerase (non-hydrolyzing) [Candidatus Eremiobacteraeota bacterium]
MRVLTIVGARPQFVKAAVLSAELESRGVVETLVHTGQHYDYNMSGAFFDGLAMRKPAHTLGVGSGGHGAQTGEMLKRLEPIAEAAAADWTIVYGDTNSTLAGALVAAKLQVPLAHVEAGLRSFDRAMPEEINRIVADSVSDLLLAPNERAASQLRAEGIRGRIAVVGDLMADLAARVAETLPARPAVLDRFELTRGEYAVATIHRASNTADAATFERLLAGLRAVGMPVVFPVHPRTAALARAAEAGQRDNILLCEPLPYHEMIGLVANARVTLTDSGGLQKETVALGVPCVTLRAETEWTETLEEGWNVLAGTDPAAIARAAMRAIPPRRIDPYGGGRCAAHIVDALLVPAARESCASSS